MKMLLSLLIVPLMAAPALAQAADKPVLKPGAEFARTISAVNRIPEATGLLAPAKPRTKASAVGRESKTPKTNQVAASGGSAASMPSFAIKGGGDGHQPSASGAGQSASALAGGSAASEPPVSFSFAASGQSYSNSNRYRGGVYMAAPF